MADSRATNARPGLRAGRRSKSTTFPCLTITVSCGRLSCRPRSQFDCSNGVFRGRWTAISIWRRRGAKPMYAEWWFRQKERARGRCSSAISAKFRFGRLLIGSCSVRKRGSAEEKALLQRYTQQLNPQESRLEALKKESKQLEDQADAAQTELDRIVRELSFDVK